MMIIIVLMCFVRIRNPKQSLHKLSVYGLFCQLQNSIWLSIFIVFEIDNLTAAMHIAHTYAKKADFIFNAFCHFICFQASTFIA